MTKTSVVRDPTPIRPRTILLAAGLFVVSWIVFGRALADQFINLDDGDYVTANPVVQHGLSLTGFRWSFGFHAGNWHPLTWWSHMLDCQLFGLNPTGHHFSSVLLHCCAAVLIFVSLVSMARKPEAIWPAAFAAAVFALHPLRVESVAWVGERKDVLSALFFGCTLLAYSRYTRQRSAGRYLWTLAFFALGLAAKPTLVTLPIVLLLLDYWPLGRLVDRAAARQLVVEKIPFFILSVMSAIVTLLAQREAVISIEALPLPSRLAQAAQSIFIYLRQFFWPTALAPFYPRQINAQTLWFSALGLLALIATTAAIFLLRRRRPVLIVGWLWFIVMLLPVIGLIQVGMQGHADRYTYLPGIGIALMIAWTGADLVRRWSIPTLVASLVSGAILALLSFQTWQQLAFWHDSKSLWTHTLAVTSNNALAEDSLGKALLSEGAIDETGPHFVNAALLRPNWAEPHADLGNALSARGRNPQAIQEYSRALALVEERSPKAAELHFNLANAYRHAHQPSQALAHYERSAAIDPNDSRVFFNWANALREQGRLDEAITRYQQAIRISPRYADAHNNLALAFSEKGQLHNAIEQYEAAIAADPHSLLALNNLALELSTSTDPSCRDTSRAVQIAEKAAQIAPENPTIVRTLATAYAQNRQFIQAGKAAEMALGMAQEQKDQALVIALERELTAYRNNLTFDQVPP